jgi:putative membrane protein
LVSPDELQRLASQHHVPNAMLQTQACRLADARAAGHLDHYLSLPIEKTLVRLADAMGACERIKKTPFPTPYAFVITRFIWLFLALLPPGLVQHLGWLTVPVSVLIALTFLLILTIGIYMQDPFENRLTDTPMHAICRTIEINLRQQLGETELPEPIEPKDGVLM